MSKSSSKRCEFVKVLGQFMNCRLASDISKLERYIKRAAVCTGDVNMEIARSCVAQFHGWLFA